jgi:hypothetical protein
VLLLYAAGRQLARLPYAAALAGVDYWRRRAVRLFFRPGQPARPAADPACRVPRCGAPLGAAILLYFDLRNRAFRRPWPRRA